MQMPWFGGNSFTFHPMVLPAGRGRPPCAKSRIEPPPGPPRRNRLQLPGRTGRELQKSPSLGMRGHIGLFSPVAHGSILQPPPGTGRPIDSSTWKDIWVATPPFSTRFRRSLVKMSITRTVCIDCLAKNGHRFIAGPNFDLELAKERHQDLGVLVTSILVNRNWSTKDDLLSVIQSLAACLRYNVRQMYLNDCSWFPAEMHLLHDSTGPIRITNKGGVVLSDECLIWESNFSSLGSSLSRSWRNDIRAACDLLLDFSDDRRISEQLASVKSSLQPS